ncbi:MAG TPA: glucose 1-dehydrogenase [Microlunatus sp.]|jgi:meso-butanediol dehydrogenase/(S,S)-butanediol dehydrogenase/diacetyl reductase|nr:glucose 1-dehydrogenase [Microlunatus sp.]
MDNGLGRRFSGRVALVTGAGHGIGRAVAERLAAEGARLVLADLDEAAAATAAAELAPAEAVGVHCDIHLTSSVEDSVSFAVEHFDGLDVLVNVAGGSMPTPAFEELTDEAWSEMLDLNLTGAVRCIRAALPALRRSPHAAIVSISSVNGLAAFGEEPYSAAKAGLGILTRNLAVRLGPAGVRVNAVAPGTVRTRVWDGQDGGADRLRPLYPLGRVGEPSDIAAAVAFLASDDASWVTGVTLPVDGGVLAGPAQLIPLLD